MNKLPQTSKRVATRAMSKVSMLVVHHVGDGRVWGDYDPLTEYTNEANYHIAKDWGGGAHGDGLMYHYKIDRNGNIYQTRELTDCVWACSNANDISINICVDGDFTQQEPTTAQLKSLQSLLKSLCTEHPEFPADQKGVYGHSELRDYGNQTACPGSLLHSVIEFRDTGKITTPSESVPLPNIPAIPVTPVNNKLSGLIKDLENILAKYK